jgi:hypothetical protein
VNRQSRGDSIYISLYKSSSDFLPFFQVVAHVVNSFQPSVEMSFSVRLRSLPCFSAASSISIHHAVQQAMRRRSSSTPSAAMLSFPSTNTDLSPYMQHIKLCNRGSVSPPSLHLPCPAITDKKNITHGFLKEPEKNITAVCLSWFFAARGEVQIFLVCRG